MDWARELSSNRLDGGVCVGIEELTVLLHHNNSIGGFYAFLLSRDSSVELSVVARSNLEAVKKNVCHDRRYH
jgi:hypothetical protein